MLAASIVVIGDEILGGYVQDSNSHWLAVRLQAHGVPVTRITTVPDELEAIDEALAAELARARPRLLLTTGGIGSTPDDITYEAVAASLGRELVEHPELVERIDGALRWTADQGIDVTDEFAWHMQRMARIPQGAQLVPHDGWAPALTLDLDGGIDADGGATIVILPGVPSQMRKIVTSAVEPQLLAGRNEPMEVVELTHGFPESALNLAFARVMQQHPQVKVGSYPGVPMLVRLSGHVDHVTPAAEQLRGEIAALESSEAGRRLADAWADRMGGMETQRR